MKPFAIWLAIVVVVFGGFALITAAVRDTTRIFVFVDSSFQMEGVWRQVPRELDRIDDRDHAEFALAEGQSRGSQLIHSWQSELELSGVVPFAPCSFGDIDRFPEAADADERILVTTTGDCAPSELVGWEIIELTP